MGVNVIYAPVARPCDEPGQPRARDPGLRRRPGGSRAARGGVRARAARRPVSPPRSSTPRAWATSRSTPTTASATVDASRDVLDAREFVPFRAAFAAGARLAMSGHVALPAVTGRRDLPATLSRAAMTDLLRDELGFDGVTISDALDMGAITGAAYGAGAEAVPDVVAVIRAGIDLLLTTPDAAARERIEAALVASARRPASSTPPSSRPATAGSSRSGRGSAVAVRCRRWTSWAARPSRSLAADLAARSLTLVRDRGDVLARPFLGTDGVGGRILAIMPRPADLTPADTSSLVAGIAGGQPAPLPSRRGRDRGPSSDPTTRRSPRSGPGRRATAVTAVVIGTIDGHRQPEQLATRRGGRRRSPDAGTPVVAVAMRGPWDVAAYPADVDRRRHLLDPARLARGALAAALAGRAGFPGRLPVTPAASTVAPVTLRDEIHEQPEVAARFLADRARRSSGRSPSGCASADIDHVVIAARGTSDHAAIYAQYVLGIRHRLSVGLATPSVISLYGASPRLDRSLVIAISQSGASPDVVAVIEDGPRARAPRPSPSPTTRLAAGGGRRDDHRAGCRPGAGDRRDQDLHDRAAGDRRAERRHDRRPGRRRRPRRDPRVARHASSSSSPTSPRWPPSRPRRTASWSSRAATSTRPRASGRSRSRSSPTSSPTRIPRPTSSTGRWRSLEPGVPVLATVRPGPTATGLIDLLAGLRDDHDAALAVASDVDGRAGPGPLAVPRCRPGTPEWLGPIVSIVVGQLHALHLTTRARPRPRRAALHHAR